MKLFESMAPAACLVVMLATPGFGQEAPAQAPEPIHGYMIALGGASTGAQNTLVLGAEYGQQLGQNAQAYATFSYHDNLLQAADRDTLRSVSQAMTLTTGLPYQFSARDRALALTLGGKFLVPTGSAIRPYAGAGAGMINVKRTISEALRGDVTLPFYADLGSVGGIVDPGQTSTTRPLGELIAGVDVSAGRAYVDVGYRYRKVFHAGGGFDFSQFSVGVGMRF